MAFLSFPVLSSPAIPAPLATVSKSVCTPQFSDVKGKRPSVKAAFLGSGFLRRFEAGPSQDVRFECGPVATLAPERPSSRSDQRAENVRPQAFEEVLNQLYPSAVSANFFLQSLDSAARSFGFTKQNTILILGLCRDEICRPLFEQMEAHWCSHPDSAGCFDMSSLAGLISMGQTGFAAAESHAPNEDGKARYLIVAMPHIAIDDNGSIGSIHREGIRKISHACGALAAVQKNYQKLGIPDTAPALDPMDLEESFVKQRLYPFVATSRAVPDLHRLTEYAAEAIEQDINILMKRTVKDTNPNYMVVTGVQIHGPFGTTYVSPRVSLALVDGNPTSFDLLEPRLPPSGFC